MSEAEAARRTDELTHKTLAGTSTSLTGSCARKVRIGNRTAWRVGDMHTCAGAKKPPPPPPVLHGAGSVLKGSFTVLIENQPATRKRPPV